MGFTPLFPRKESKLRSNRNSIDDYTSDLLRWHVVRKEDARRLFEMPISTRSSGERWNMKPAYLRSPLSRVMLVTILVQRHQAA